MAWRARLKLWEVLGYPFPNRAVVWYLVSTCPGRECVSESVSESTGHEYGTSSTQKPSKSYWRNIDMRLPLVPTSCLLPVVSHLRPYRPWASLAISGSCRSPARALGSVSSSCCFSHRITARGSSLHRPKKDLLIMAGINGRAYKIANNQFNEKVIKRAEVHNLRRRYTI
jgi:hypothetical protein